MQFNRVAIMIFNVFLAQKQRNPSNLSRIIKFYCTLFKTTTPESVSVTVQTVFYFLVAIESHSQTLQGDI